MPDVLDKSRLEPWLRLLLTPELRKVNWCRLHRAFGGPDAILGASAEAICQAAGVAQETARAILEGPDAEQLASEWRWIEQTGTDVYTFDDDGYPQNLRQCSTPPMFLYAQGGLQPGDRYAVVVVGTRTMTQYGKLACQKLVAELVGAGVTVISGMAHGIDTVAHDTTLRHGGRTVAVLAQGLAARESSHRVARREQIAQNGAVLSEFPMTASPERYHYPVRNHTMAAMGLATVVVEAAEKSGALITAEKALEENRDVFAVPGDVTRQTSTGTNALIRAGATLARNGRDVLEDLHSQLSALLNETSGAAATAREAPPLDMSHLSETARRVLARVGSEPIHLDALHAQVGEEGMNIGALAAALLELETKGLVHHLPGNLYTTGPAL